MVESNGKTYPAWAGLVKTAFKTASKRFPGLPVAKNARIIADRVRRDTAAIPRHNRRG
jgi:hypothetical protein